MSRWLPKVLLVLLAVAVAALSVETFRLAELAGKREVELFGARAELVSLRAAAAQPADRPTPPPVPESTAEVVGASDYARLKLELHTTQQQLAATTALLEQRNEELARRAEAADERAARALQPIPEGVRQCLEALHDCLRLEGFYQQRFLRAASLDDEGLHDVELLDAAEDGLGVAFLSAARMTAQLDRAEGRLELRFFDGARTAGGERMALPDDGFVLTFREVDGRLFERRLPYLVRGEGGYPAPVDPDARPSTDVDAGTRRQWLARLDKVLAQSGTAEAWRATRLRGMQDGWFLEVDLVATDEKSHVVASVHCARMAVEVDRERGVVSLRMLDGVLRRLGAESTITGEGYRMLLPRLSPQKATDAMFGMVVSP